MSILREWANRFRDTFSPRRRDSELHEELRLHLEMALEDAARRGDDARQLRATLGLPAVALERLRDQRGVPWLADLSHDVRYAWRGLADSPGFATVVILTLALGTGANTAIFSLVNALMLRPLPVHQPEALVELLSVYPDPAEPRHNLFSRNFYEAARQRGVFAELAGVVPMRLEIGRDAADLAELHGDLVSGGFFRMLGLEAAAGRLIEPEDEAANADVAVVSWAYWQSRLNGDPDVLGQQLTIGGAPKTIIGVAPRRFTGMFGGREAQVWLPAGRETRFALFARLRDRGSRKQAEAALAPLNQDRVKQIAERSGDPRWLGTTLLVESARSGASSLRDRFGSTLLILMAVVAVLLAVACTNIAGLLLARGAAKQRELAVRVSLGAGRGRLVRQLLVESLLLSFVGSAFGIAIAWWGATTLARVLLPDLPDIAIAVTPDAPVLLYTTAVAILVAILFGTAPVWQALALGPSAALADVRGGEPKSRRLFGRGLVIAQVALSAALLSTAGLFVRHLWNLQTVDLGFRRDSVVLVRLIPPGGMDRDQMVRTYRDLLARFEALPFVRSATLSAITPIEGGEGLQFVQVEGFDEAPEARRRVSLNWIAPRYFETYGTPLIAGRDFRFEDRHGSRVAIVNQAFARYYFPDGQVVGRHVTLERDRRPYQIIGVAADAKYSNLRLPPPRTLYMNALASQNVPSKFALHTATDPAAVLPSIRAAVTETAKNLQVGPVTTLSAQMDSTLIVERVLASLGGWFGALGAILAATGVYGLLAYSVTRRTHEIGIRVALGATPMTIVAMVLRSAIGLVLAGCALALPLAFWSERAALRLVENLPSNTSGSAGLLALGMLVVGLAAAFLPARHAAAVDPVEALRHD